MKKIIKLSESDIYNLVKRVISEQSTQQDLVKDLQDDINKIINNIECYDFNDILGLFNYNLVPNKKNNVIDCSDTDTHYWD